MNGLIKAVPCINIIMEQEIKYSVRIRYVYSHTKVNYYYFKLLVH